MKDLKYLFAFTIPLTVFLSIYLKDIFSYTTLVYAYGVIPLFELIFKPKSYEEKRVVSSDLKNIFFDSLLYLNFPIVTSLLFYGFNVLSLETTFFYEEVGIVLSLAILLATNGINVAHELGHRKSGFAKNISKSLLLYSLYMHFFIEHNKGHHKNVGTPLDPASAKFNQSLYSFWVQSVIGQYINAWKIQLKELNTNSNSFFSIKNQMLIFLFFQISYLVVIGLVFTIKVAFLAVLVGVISFLMLETINYIEHYGLTRKKMKSGRYERVQTHHSWNSEHQIGRIVLYELTRHSDHHYNASKEYQFLENKFQSPQLPYGYPASMLLALIPSLWFFVMNKRVIEFSKNF